MPLPEKYEIMMNKDRDFEKATIFFILGTFYPSVKPFRKLNKSHLKDF